VQRLGPPDGRPELLALRALKLGDLLVSVPALHALRRAYPEHRLVLATTPWLEPVVDLVPGVDALLPTPRGLDEPLAIDAGRVDVAVNLHGRGPASTRMLDAIGPARVFAHADPGHPGPEWVDGMLERRRWARLVSWHGADADEDEVAIAPPATPTDRPGAAIVHIGAFYGSRSWPAERFAAVARELAAAGRDVVITGGGNERERAERVGELAGLGPDAVAAGVLDLDRFAALVAGAALIVTVDTGAAHLASAYRLPSVIVFGPAPPEEWGPPPGPHAVLTHAGVRVGDAFGDEPDPALLAVTVDEVLAAVAELPAR